MPISVLRASNLESIPGLVHGFTTREGGISTGPFESLNLGWSTGDDDKLVQDNYRLLAEQFKLAPDQVIGIRQTHGSDVIIVDDRASSQSVHTKNGDAVVTSQTSMLLTVRVADCLPILIADLGRRVVGAVHAGWRGTLAGVSAQTVNTMKERFTVESHDLLVAIGPAIGPCCFEVSLGVAELFRQEIGLEGKEVRETDSGAYLDLRAIHVRLLRQLGVRPDRIWVSDECTKCNEKKFFSYRRDGKRSGRMVGLIGWVP